MRDPVNEMTEALRRAADGARTGTPNGTVIRGVERPAAVPPDVWHHWYAAPGATDARCLVGVEPCPLCGWHHAAALACSLAGRG